MPLREIVIRRGAEFIVRPNAEQVDGKIFNFEMGWELDDGDLQAHPECQRGESAWLPRDQNYPKTAPCWISSGDLKEVNLKK